MSRPDPETRFWARVDKRGPDDCWPWTGRLLFGYGSIYVAGKSLRVHRYAYELLVGPIPEGLTLDHLCHTRDQSCLGGDGCLHRACVNPAHLEPVTHYENWYRGRAPSRLVLDQDCCANGHPWTDENTRIRASGRGRECIECGRVRTRAHYDRYGDTPEHRARRTASTRRQRARARVGVLGDTDGNTQQEGNDGH